MSARLRLLALLLAASLPAAAGTPQKKAKTAPPPAAPAVPARLTISLDGLVDRRTSADFPHPRMEFGLKLEGEDAPAAVSAMARVTKAEDDTGKSLLVETQSGASDMWQEARGDQPPRPSAELASPSRKAKSLVALEGVVSAYLPSRDPNAVVKVDKVMTRKDKPPVVSTALAAQKIKLQVLSKEGLEKEKKAAEEKKKADAAKKKKAKKGGDGMEEMGEAMADALGQMFERLFMMAGEHDLVLKVDDPGKKIFSFGVTGPDGKPIQTYGDMQIEGYRIVKIFEALPEGATLEVRLKTPKSFAEVPFKLADVKLP